MEVRRLFFYGTLCHAPLLRLVLGEGAHPEQAKLQDHAVYWVKDQPFPTLIEQAGGTAQGVVINATPEQIARLDFYEGGFDYALKDVRVETAQGALQALVYFAQQDFPKGAAWDLQGWARQYGPLTLLAAQEVMSYYGLRPAQDIAAMFPMIRTRAQARLNGRAGREGVEGDVLTGENVEITNRRRVYSNFFAVDEFDVRFDHFDGTKSPKVQRATFMAADAVIVLPYDPKRDRVLLVEQVRMGPISRDDPNPWMLEPIAGRIDGGETPEQAAHREAQEEAGLSLRHLEPIAQVYPTPGTSNEFFYMYCALCDLPDAAAGTFGLADEAEDIKTHILSYNDLMRRSDAGHFANAVLSLMALWLARHRDRLRNGA